MIKRVIYKNGGGEGSWLTKGISGLFGTNVTVTNKYDSRHRMKLRMFDQDYLIYKAMGMTVRMQKRTLGIWWRKKAQEFRYGWSAIECEYEFKKPAFPEPPKLPNGMYRYQKHPVAMSKNFPFSETDIVLFNLPINDYEVTTGDINKVLLSGLKSLSKTINEWFKNSENARLVNNPRGLYISTKEDKVIKVVFPQGEEVDYRSGREVIKWDERWFSGIFKIGFKYNPDGGLKFDDLKLSPSNGMKIIRARIYGAVKYDNEWRACIIETK